MITSDKRMVELIDKLQSAGIIRFRQEFLDVIGMLKQNYGRVVEGKQHFSAEQIARACAAYRINANWILGLEETMAAGGRRNNTNAEQQKVNSLITNKTRSINK